MEETKTAQILTPKEEDKENMSSSSSVDVASDKSNQLQAEEQKERQEEQEEGKESQKQAEYSQQEEEEPEEVFGAENVEETQILKEEVKQKLEQLKQESRIKKANDELKRAELEEDPIAGICIKADTRLMPQTRITRLSRQLEFCPLQNIEQLEYNEIMNKTDEPVLKDVFIMGVVVEKERLSTSFKTNKKGVQFIRFKLSDLQTYNPRLVQRVKNNTFNEKSDPEKVKVYRMMKFTPDCYKIVNCMLFGETAKKFSDEIFHGYVIIMKMPKNMESGKYIPVTLKVDNETNFMAVGVSRDYTICSEKDCLEFLNRQKSSKCKYHRMKEEDTHLQMIKSQRPFLRSNFVNSSRQKRIKGFENGLVKNQPQNFSKFKAPKWDQKSKQKPKRKVLFQNDDFTNYIEKRKKKQLQTNALDNLKTTEGEFMKKMHTPLYKEIKTLNEKSKVMLESSTPSEKTLDEYSKLLNLSKKKEIKMSDMRIVGPGDVSSKPAKTSPKKFVSSRSQKLLKAQKK
ncbi:unnamed protein product [Moneuplotes crassus]|uniref:Zinc finger Mcm10/DnaG-type domain-containing protein n=1 Tax=Euplotes crassus TaxID=5936 RepID=A0AAD1XCM9_EUPCR|nr:unnamed protein product [Moneuplotes crassus]